MTMRKGITLALGGVALLGIGYAAGAADAPPAECGWCAATTISHRPARMSCVYFREWAREPTPASPVRHGLTGR